MPEPTEPQEVVNEGWVPVAPPDVIRGVIGDSGQFLDDQGKVLGTYAIGSRWTIGSKGQKTPVARFEVVVADTHYFGTSKPAIGSKFSGLSSPALARRMQVTMAKWRANRAAPVAVQPAPAPKPVQASLPASSPVREYVCWSLRREVVTLLGLVDPAGHAEYGRIKYAGTQRPSLDQRRKAYLFAFQRVMEVCYHVPDTSHER